MKYQVYYKNYLGQWVADSKKFDLADHAKAIRHSKKVAKNSENGKIAIQKVN